MKILDNKHETRYHFYGDGKLLNRVDSTGSNGLAAIAGWLQVVKTKNVVPEDKLDVYSSTSLQISDCNKSIYLNLEFETDDNYNNSLEKLRIINTITSSMIKELKKARKQYIKLNKEIQNETR